MINTDTSKQLKLLAMDREDLDVISAVCQDAVLRVDDLEYLSAEKRFLLSLNRFVWEKDASGSRRKPHERRRTVLHFESVKSVKVMGIDRNQKELILSLMAIKFEAGEEPEGEIELVFAGDGAIRLSVTCIEAQLADLGASWGTRNKPSHNI